MERKENKVFVIAFITLVFILFLSLLAGKFFHKQIVELDRKNSILNANTIDVNWEKLYPYDTKVVESGLPLYTTNKNDSIIAKISNSLTKFENIGTNLSAIMYKGADISKTGYIINSKLTDPSIGNKYIKLKNGYWVSVSNPKVDFNTAINDVSNYYYLQKYLETKNINFLYFYSPTKECAIDNQMPDGVTSYANENIDIYINAMNKLKINNVDLRETLHKDNLDHYSLFYKTDHHWNVDAGFWATSEIENELNKRFDLKIKNINQIGSFSKTVYKNAMFGSMGKTVSHFNEKSEDFDILFPNFKNNFSLEIPDKGINTTGDFKNIFIDYKWLNTVEKEGGGYAYDSILYGNRPYEKITNLNNKNGPKILMIRDSFSIAVAPYLAFSCSELVLIDTRNTNGNFTGSIINCINQFKPDVVLAIQSSPQSITLNK